jgi:hypothetical protein
MEFVDGGGTGDGVGLTTGPPMVPALGVGIGSSATADEANSAGSTSPSAAAETPMRRLRTALTVPPETMAMFGAGFECVEALDPCPVQRRV